MMKKKSVIAMSCGVDSSVAALLTKEEGDQCIGVTMKLFDNQDIGERMMGAVIFSRTEFVTVLLHFPVHSQFLLALEEKSVYNSIKVKHI